MKRPTIPIPFRKPRSRLGCLGSLLSFVVVSLAAYFLIYLPVLALLYPWSFFLGGSFHLIPGWQGWGKLHARSGDFILYIYRSDPSLQGGLVHPDYPRMRGTAKLCTPRGERYEFMRVTMNFQNKGFGLNSDNQPVTLSVYNYGLRGRFESDYRPSFSLEGAWHNPNLVLEDHGSLARAFLPDGRAYLGPTSKQPPAGENLSITLTPGNYSDFKAACQTNHK